MEENFVWMTTRRIKPGTLADLKRTWRAERHPDGMLHAHAYWSDDEQKIIAVSSSDSRESCETWRASWEGASRSVARQSRSFPSGCQVIGNADGPRRPAAIRSRARHDTASRRYLHEHQPD